MSRRPHIRAHGFTLIEVLVAMAVVALGIGALLSTLNSAAASISYMRNRSLAEWIALNRISETRLAGRAPSTGVTTGEVEYAGNKWVWRQEVIDQDVSGILRLNVSVALATDTALSKQKAGDSFAALATGYGFYGTEVGVSNGLEPTWTQAAPRNPGGTGPPNPNPDST
jgi:general secretion pathway protein I